MHPPEEVVGTRKRAVDRRSEVSIDVAGLKACWRQR